MRILCNITTIWDNESQQYVNESIYLKPANYEIGRNYVGSIGDTTYNTSISLAEALEVSSREELEELGYKVEVL